MLHTMVQTVHEIAKVSGRAVVRYAECCIDVNSHKVVPIPSLLRRRESREVLSFVGYYFHRFALSAPMIFCGDWTILYFVLLLQSWHAKPSSQW